MKKQKTLWPAIMMVCMMALWPFAGCEKDPLVVEGDLSQIEGIIGDSLDRTYWEQVALNARQFDSLACGTLTRPADPPHMDEPQLLSGPTTTLQNGISCVTRSYRWELGDQSAFLYDPTADVFFPTNVLDGTSIQTGAYRPIVAPISPKVLSVSLENVGGSPKITVQNPTLGNVRESVAELLRQLNPMGTPAKLSMILEEVHSSEQTSVAVRANYKGFGARVNAAFDWNSSEEKSRFLLNFLQVYYTLDMDITHTSPSAYFVAESLPNMADFNQGMPVYVSSIKYGRQIMFAVESSRSASEVSAALQASYNSVAFGGGISIAAAHQQTLQNSKISAFVVGGSGAVVTENITDAASLLNIMREGGNYSASSPGAPLAYTLRYLCDNSIAKIALAAEYTVRECEEIGEELILPTTMTARLYDGCPVRVHGDDEFGGPAVKITGNINLKIREDRKAVLAEIYFYFNEPLPDNDSDDTRAELRDTIVIAELYDQSRYISSILSSTTSNIDFTPNSNGNHHPPFSGNFMHDIIIQADGGGDDLPCVGYTDNPDGRAFVRLMFKNSIRVNVKNW